MWPPRIIVKASVWWNIDAPGTSITLADFSGTGLNEAADAAEEGRDGRLLFERTEGLAMSRFNTAEIKLAA